MTPLVSVVVPVYNAGSYLEDCVASLRAQTLQEMEFIFVDDCSTDDSLSVLQKAAKEDGRIRVIAQPVNRGVSAARNAGIDAAQGSYIGFTDADDTVEPEMFRELLEACRRAEAEISFCRVFKDKPSGQENVPLGFADGTRFDEKAIREDLIPAMLSRPQDGDELPLSGYTPRNLFARRVIGSRRFREDIRYAEDLLFIVTCMLEARASIAVDRAYYHYRFHAASATKKYSPFIPESLERSNSALETLLGSSPECMRRMKIRRRKMAVDAVRNYCAEGTPCSLPERWKRIRSYLKREDIRALYRDVQLSRLPRRTAIKYGLMKHRCALLLTALFSTAFRARL